MIHSWVTAGNVTGNVPLLPEAVADMLLPATENTTVALLMKLGEETGTPLTSNVEPKGPAANVSILTKSSATIGSIPLRLKSRFGVIGSLLCT